jgi:probable phosphoglycerate mutase
MRLYLIRHADPDYDNNTITAQGHREAAALAERLATEGLTRIYSSPMGRARHTAQYTAEKLGIEVGIEEWTRELPLSVVCGEPKEPMAPWDVPGEHIRKAPPYPSHADWFERTPYTEPVIRETFETVRRNSDRFIAGFGYVRDGGRYRIEKPNRERIAVFCHGGFGLTWLAHLLEIPVTLMWSGFWLPPSSVTTVLFEERSAEWAVPRCIGLGDVSHLHMAGLGVQPSGIKANFD